MIVLLSAVIAILIGTLIIAWNHWQCKFDSLIKWHEELMEAQRKKTLKESRSVLRGQISEQIVPMLPDFPYNLQDAKFMGAPLDYIVFDGMSAVRDGDPFAKINIVFTDVKFNKAGLNRVQREIRKAVEEKRVEFKTITVNTENQLKVK